MKLVNRSIGITLIIFGILLGIFMLTERQTTVFPDFISSKGKFAIPYQLATTNFPFYAGICVFAGAMLLIKGNKDI
ncbi:hypothetical protein PV783_11975 [Chitinophaga sp. CC14]|uniref:hypothetical protein n=1 Tax=Chitinophaga sp. CC14 TaxID=3029199 RepID=UPI003B7AD9CB